MNRVTISLPCTPFSYRYLTSRYGDNIVTNSRINRQFWMSLSKLCVITPDNSASQLTARVEITVTGRLSSEVQKPDGIMTTSSKC